VTGVQTCALPICLADRPTAVICTNDMTALGVLSKSKELGIQVPNDLSVISFDAIPQTAYSQPPLTTFRQPLDEMGYAAGEILFKKLNSMEQPLEIRIFPMELVEGGSVLEIG
jgi:DNA-binding LacI/PurR family transcriptional regulator